MPHPSSRWLTVLFGWLLLAACGQKKDDAAPAPGAISGLVTPAQAIASVVATDAASHPTTAVPGPSGEYRLEPLTPGAYTLRFVPAAGYTTPASQTLTVLAGRTVGAAPVTSTVVVGSVVGNFQYSGTLAQFDRVVTAVTATDASNRTVSVAPSPTGQYALPNLAPGPCTVSFTIDPDFAPVASKTVTVSSGTSVIVPPVPLVLLTTGSVTVDGTVTNSPSASGIYPSTFPVANSLRLILATTINGLYQQAAVYVGNFASVPGTFPLQNNPNNYADFSLASSSPPTQGWAVDRSRPGTIVITSVKDNPRRVSGSFNYVALPATGGATGQKAVSGSFTNAPY